MPLILWGHSWGPGQLETQLYRGWSAGSHHTTGRSPQWLCRYWRVSLSLGPSFTWCFFWAAHTCWAWGRVIGRMKTKQSQWVSNGHRDMTTLPMHKHSCTVPSLKSPLPNLTSITAMEREARDAKCSVLSVSLHQAQNPNFCWKSDREFYAAPEKL